MNANKQDSKRICPLLKRKEGDKSQALCPHCKELQNTTYRFDTYIRTDKLGHNKKAIDNVLLAFCDVCGNLASIPHQSVIDIWSDV